MLWKAVVLVCFLAEGQCVRGVDRELFYDFDRCLSRIDEMESHSEDMIIQHDLGPATVTSWCEQHQPESKKATFVTGASPTDVLPVEPTVTIWPVRFWWRYRIWHSDWNNSRGR